MSVIVVCYYAGITCISGAGKKRELNSDEDEGGKLEEDYEDEERVTAAL